MGVHESWVKCGLGQARLRRGWHVQKPGLERGPGEGCGGCPKGLEYGPGEGCGDLPD